MQSFKNKYKKEPGLGARLRIRHLLVILSFFILVVIPSGTVIRYLVNNAKDQYVSTLAFTVRSQDVSAALDLLGGLSALGSGSSSDSDILYEYIQSKTIVSEIDSLLDLRKIYSSYNTSDPWFGFKSRGTIEDLLEYWPQMIKVYYDKGTGLIEVQVRAFTAQQAKLIADKIYELCTKMINTLNAAARQDAIAYAREELDVAFERLKNARKSMTQFRSLNQMIDPQAEIEMQAGVISALQNKVSELLIEYDILLTSSGLQDPRLNEISQRIDIIHRRIEIEREKFASENGDFVSYSNLVSEFEGLLVDREYAEAAYIAALTAYDSSVTEAKRKSLYLASYVTPTVAEKAEHPKRILLSVIASLSFVFIWFIMLLFVYAVKDRR